jgi:cytochrome d ubiquinol oxidase subunit II
MTIPLDYATLRVIWWILLGLLLIGFAVMDGFDLGIGIVLHRVARTDEERRIVLNSIGPVWEGNQVWFILGGGAIFAAWPEIYAVSFSGFYYAMLMILFALILRPVGFKYRSKLASTRWRSLWDAGIFIAGLVPALVFGVAVGNVLQGVPFYYDDNLQSYYTGTLWGLLNPFALLCGLVSISMLVMHGCNFLAIKTEGVIEQRAICYAKRAAFVTMVLFALAGIWVALRVSGYVVTNPMPEGLSNPLHKSVTMQLGAWLLNYKMYPLLSLVPIGGFVFALASVLFGKWHCAKTAWLFSALCIASIITTVGVSMFPFILPSSIHPEMSLLAWDASSSHLTLFIMLIAVVIFLPLILLYTSWVYYVLRGKVTKEYLQQNKLSVY